ncbi:MAG: hypothetical protein ACK4WH_03470 [Phycisphaerales bacterium]
MPGTRVVIEISPSALVVTTLRGRVHIARREARFDRQEWPEPWTEGLAEASEHLGQFVEELGCAGWTAEILYRSPGTTVSISSCPAAASFRDVENAARLQLARLLNGGGGSAVSSIGELFRDAAAGNGTPQVHTIAAADADQRLTDLTSWAAAAGLHVEGVIPLECAVVAAAVAEAADLPSDGPPTATLWVEEDLSVLAMGCRTRLRSVRTLGLGLRALADAMRHPVCLSEERRLSEGSGRTLDHRSAHALLFEVGVPSPQQALPGAEGLTGASVLPSLQPTLQRIAVDLKQTIRFGLEESERATVQLCVRGPGAGVPNLEATLARFAGCRCAGRAWAEDDRSARLYAAGVRAPRLLPIAERERIGLRRARRVMGVGAGIASVMLIVNAISAHADVERETARLEAIQKQSAGEGAMAEIQMASIGSLAAAEELEARVRERMGSWTPWGAALREIARITPGPARLTEVDLNAADPGKETAPTCRIRGYVESGSGTDPIGALRALSNSLRELPIVSDLKLGPTLWTEVRGKRCLAFELTVALVPLPQPTNEECEAWEKGSNP